MREQIGKGKAEEVGRTQLNWNRNRGQERESLQIRLTIWVTVNQKFPPNLIGLLLFDLNRVIWGACKNVESEH